MANISLKFTNRNGRFCLCATVKGISIQHYRAVDELRNPDFKTWDKSAQRFVSRRPIDSANNKILSDVLRHYEDLLERYDFESSRELFAYQEETEHLAVQESKPKPLLSKPPKKTATPPSVTSNAMPGDNMTLGKWLEQIIEEIKNPKRLKPSVSYQGYLTLLHKLEAEGKLIKQPLTALGDDSFVQLIKWLNKRKGKNSKAQTVGFELIPDILI